MIQKAVVESIKLENFTAFKHLALDFSPGVNIFIGANGTGKTHLLKLLYTALVAAQADVRQKAAFEQKLTNVFRPKGKRLGRLAHRSDSGVTCNLHIMRNGAPFVVEFTHHAKEYVKKFQNEWEDPVQSAVYVPVKEVLVEAPGFRSLYEQGMLKVEEIYFDIISKAFVPIPSGQPSQERKLLSDALQQVLHGRITEDDEQFYLDSDQGELEFPLVAEGFRKFGLLWRLIQNGTLWGGTTLFWDEPEANINPSMIKTLVEILLHLQRQGVQIFIATHSYVLLKEFDLQGGEENDVRYFSLTRDKSGAIVPTSGESYIDVVPNEIGDAYTAIYDAEVQRSLGL